MGKLSTRKVRPLADTLEVRRPRGPQRNRAILVHAPADTPFEAYRGQLAPADADYVRHSQPGRMFAEHALTNSGKPVYDPDLGRYRPS